MSNTAQEYQKKMAAAFRSGDAEEFSTLSDKFLSIIDMVEKVTGTQKEFLVGTWINGAKKLAENFDDFTKELYELNARSLITTWGSYDQAISGGLIDYSNRQWAGLTNDYYKMRWEKWITERKKNLPENLIPITLLRTGLRWNGHGQEVQINIPVLEWS